MKIESSLCTYDDDNAIIYVAQRNFLALPFYGASLPRDVGSCGKFNVDFSRVALFELPNVYRLAAVAEKHALPEVSMY